jgi:hypothetical protein
VARESKKVEGKMLKGCIFVAEHVTANSKREAVVQTPCTCGSVGFALLCFASSLVCVSFAGR